MVAFKCGLADAHGPPADDNQCMDDPIGRWLDDGGRDLEYVDDDRTDGNTRDLASADGPSGTAMWVARPVSEDPIPDYLFRRQTVG